MKVEHFFAWINKRVAQQDYKALCNDLEPELIGLPGADNKFYF